MWQESAQVVEKRCSVPSNGTAGSERYNLAGPGDEGTKSLVPVLEGVRRPGVARPNSRSSSSTSRQQPGVSPSLLGPMQGPGGVDAGACSWMTSLDFLGAEDLMGTLGAPGDMAFLDPATLAAVCSVGQHQAPGGHSCAPGEAQAGQVVVKRQCPEDEDDSDDDEARGGGRPGCSKRAKSGGGGGGGGGENSSEAARTKASKEKARRGKINDRFSELAKMIEPPGSEPKTDKPSILGDAIKFVQQMTVENHQLKQLNKFLEERVAHYERERGQNLYQQSLMVQGMHQPPPPQQQQQHAMQMQQHPMQMQAMQQQQQQAPPGMMQVQPLMQHQQHQQHQHQHQPMMQQMQVVQQQQQQQQQPMMQTAGGSLMHMPGPSHAGSGALQPAGSTHLLQEPVPPSAPAQQQFQQQQQQQQYQVQPIGAPQPQQQQQQQQQQHSLATATSLDAKASSDDPPPHPLPSATTATSPCPQHYSVVPMPGGGGQQYAILHMPSGPPQHHFYSSDLKSSLSGGQGGAMQAPMMAMQPMGMQLMGPGAKPHPTNWVAHMLDSAQDSLLRPPAA